MPVFLSHCSRTFHCKLVHANKAMFTDADVFRFLASRNLKSAGAVMLLDRSKWLQSCQEGGRRQARHMPKAVAQLSSADGGREL